MAFRILQSSAKGPGMILNVASWLTSEATLMGAVATMGAVGVTGFMWLVGEPIVRRIRLARMIAAATAPEIWPRTDTNSRRPRLAVGEGWYARRVGGAAARETETLIPRVAISEPWY